MKRGLLAGMLLLGMMLIFAGCGGNGTEKQGAASSNGGKKVELTVLAAASLTDALNELKGMYEKNHSDITITYSFGASGTLAQQLEQGVPADLFISASEKFMDQVEGKGLIQAESRKTFVKNIIVLIGSKEGGKKTTLAELDPNGVKQMAIGDPKTVPAGSYSREVLTALHKWSDLEKKLVYGKDVRQVLTYVETGNVDYGMVFLTDALLSKQVEVLDKADPSLHTPITYPIALVKESPYPQESKAFYQFLLSPEGKKVLEKYGFGVE